MGWIQSTGERDLPGSFLDPEEKKKTCVGIYICRGKPGHAMVTASKIFMAYKKGLFHTLHGQGKLALIGSTFQDLGMWIRPSLEYCHLCGRKKRENGKSCMSAESFCWEGCTTHHISSHFMAKATPVIMPEFNSTGT